MMLEHWCWVPDQLKRLSRHVITGEKIPDKLLHNLIRTRHVTRIFDSFQVALSAFDLAVYSPASQKEAEDMNLAELYNKTRREFTGLKDAEALGMARLVLPRDLLNIPNVVPDIVIVTWGSIQHIRKAPERGNQIVFSIPIAHRRPTRRPTTAITVIASHARWTTLSALSSRVVMARILSRTW